MARSEEAILRRALKRTRTEGEQRQADRNEMRRQELKQKAKKAESDRNDNSKRPRVSDLTRRNETGRQNFGDRRSQSFRRDRGSGNPWRSNTTSRSPSSKRQKKPRHNEETSKKLVWSRQADTKTLSKNQELRQRYKEAGGEGMSPEDLERAKLLIARDQRKQERKNKKKMNKTITDSIEASAEAQTNPPVEDGTSAETPKEKEEVAPEPAQEKSETKTKKKKKTSDAQAKRDQNKALRLRYLETNGKGMKEDQIERAKLLIARDEKKKQKRGAQKEQQQSEKKQ